MFFNPIKRNTCPDSIRVIFQINESVKGRGTCLLLAMSHNLKRTVTSLKPTLVSMEAILKVVQDLTENIKSVAPSFRRMTFSNETTSSHMGDNTIVLVMKFW